VSGVLFNEAGGGVCFAARVFAGRPLTVGGKNIAAAKAGLFPGEHQVGIFCVGAKIHI
jgi:hypothetical protein